MRAIFPGLSLILLLSAPADAHDPARAWMPRPYSSKAQAQSRMLSEQGYGFVMWEQDRAKCGKAIRLVEDVYDRLLRDSHYLRRMAAEDPAPKITVRCPEQQIQAKYTIKLITLNGGLIAHVLNEDELAFVIAHELGHHIAGVPELIARHREGIAEDLADEIALELVSRAGYDVEAALDLISRLSFPHRPDRVARRRLIRREILQHRYYSVQRTDSAALDEAKAELSEFSVE